MTVSNTCIIYNLNIQGYNISKAIELIFTDRRENYLRGLPKDVIHDKVLVLNESSNSGAETYVNDLTKQEITAFLH